MKRVTQGIHPSLNISNFLESEKKIINTFLSKEWLITRSGTETFSNNEYRYIIAKPPKVYTDLFNLVREFIIVFSPFDEFQPRTLNAIEKIQQSFKGLRIEKICSVVISKSPKIEEEIKKLLLSDPEVQIVVPFSYREFNNTTNNEFVKNRFKEYFFSRDLFAFQSELKKDLYFFGRNEIVHKLVTRHNSNENSGLFGLRKTGKTSILHGVRRVLSTENTLSVIINCQSPDFNLKNWNNALYYIIKQIKEQNNIVQKIRDETLYVGDKTVESFEKDLKSVLNKSKSKNVLIILDEIEHITYEISHIPQWKKGYDFLTFWQALRSIFQKEDNLFTFLIAGTNSKAIEFTTINFTDNPIFELIPKDSFIPSFSVNQVEEMVSNLGKIMGLFFDDIIYSKLKEDFGGHPFLIRQVCSYIHKTVKTERPARVDKIIYQKAKESYNKNNTTYNEMILEVLKNFYNDEYLMLEFLAINDLKTFKEFADLSPSYTRHLLGYGIIDENNGDYHFKIESIKDYLSEKKKYKKIKLTQEEKQKEISERRNRIEPKIRAITRTILFSKYGENEAKRIVLKIMGGNREKKYFTSALKDIFDPNKSMIYYEDLRKIINKEWESFENIFGRDKNDFNTYMNNVNKYRVDTHAKTISDDEMSLFRVSITKIEEKIEKYL
jgi:hypothetical protein